MKPFLKTNFFKLFIIVVLVVLMLCAVAAYVLWSRVLKPNVSIEQAKSAFIFIPTGSDFNQLKDSLYRHNYISNVKSFEWVSVYKGLTDKVKPGRYEIVDGMSNNTLVDILRAGYQSPVNLTFNNQRTTALLSGRLALYLEPDSATLEQHFNDLAFLSAYGKTPKTAIALFIPNTYQFFWNTDVKGIFDRMKKEYDRFWNADRMAKADAMGLSPDEVITLASIVQEETNKNDEKQRVAGVYVNRIKINMHLQADPTLKFAMNDFSIRRILDEYKNIESPYNTYKYIGLPPGPICMPDVSSIDAVLNYEEHGYYYFCAHDDLSGYHVFAKSLAEHNINARKYHNALNRLKIYQ